MPTLTARLDREQAAVVLTINDRAGVQAIVRTDANGTRPVRIPGGEELPGLGGGSYTDHEVALGGLVSYRLDHPDAQDLVWVNLSGAWAPRFIIPSIPQISAEAEIVTGYDATQDSTATFHQVINRSSPLVVEGRLSLRRGTMVAQFDTLAGSSGLREMLRRGKTVMFRQSEHPGQDMYFHIESLTVTADPEIGQWSVSLAYVEVAFPLGAILSTRGWTFEAVKLAHTDFIDVATSYSSYLDLGLGGGDRG